MFVESGTDGNSPQKKGLQAILPWTNHLNKFCLEKYWGSLVTYLQPGDHFKFRKQSHKRHQNRVGALKLVLNRRDTLSSFVAMYAAFSSRADFPKRRSV